MYVAGSVEGKIYCMPKFKKKYLQDSMKENIFEFENQETEA